MDDSDIYAELPPRTYSLREFNRHAKDLLASDESDEFVRFSLTGEVAGDHQVVVDPLRDLLDPHHEITLSRDYDSILGITERIVVNSQLSVYPICNPADALATSIHLDYSFEGGEVSRIPLGSRPVPDAHLESPLPPYSEYFVWQVEQPTHGSHFLPRACIG